MPCIAPSEVVTTPIAAAFGLIAEQFIGREYLSWRKKLTFFPASQADFQDISVGFGNVALHIAFLKACNPHVSTKALYLLSVSGFLKIPDLITHDGVIEEFYEIKPDSISGRAAGVLKITALAAAYSHMSIPYNAGTRWAPNQRILICSGPVLGYHVEIYFHYFRARNGLVLYEICIDGELEKLALSILLSIIAAIIVVIIGRGVLRPSPVPPPVPAMV